jgi:hypothetical protein
MGYIWGAGGFVEECAVYVPPTSEGESARDSLQIAGNNGGGMTVKAPIVVATGAWYSLVLQFFPDGRCGAAINGEPVAITRPKPIRTDKFYVSFFGNSVGTKMLVGETTVSIGVAKDIDWEHARPPR